MMKILILTLFLVTLVNADFNDYRESYRFEKDKSVERTFFDLYFYRSFATGNVGTILDCLKECTKAGSKCFGGAFYNNAMGSGTTAFKCLLLSAKPASIINFPGGSQMFTKSKKRNNLILKTNK
jgi:hypothetical protein